MLKRIRNPKVAGLCGVAGPIVFFVCLLVALTDAPWFSWTGNAISDLAAVSVLLNSGIIVSGALGLVFATGLWKKGRRGAALFALDMLLLCCVGIFPESAGILHTIASYAFFALGFASLLVIGLDGKDAFPVVLGIIMVASLATIPLFGLTNYAIPEIISTSALAAYSITTGMRFLRKK
jgi:hypothetical membrane protein